MRVNLKSIKIISYLWIGTLLGAILNFASQAILARNLGTEHFGSWSTALTVIATITPLAGFGISNFWLRIFGKEGWRAIRWLPASLTTIFLSTMIAFGCVAMWAVFTTPNTEARTPLLILSGLLLGSISIDMASTKLQLEEKFLQMALWQLLPPALKFFGILLLIYASDSLLNLTKLSWLFSGISIGVALLLYLQLREFFHGQIDLVGHEKQPTYLLLQSDDGKVGVRQILKKSWAFGTANFFHLIYFQGSILALKHLMGDAQAGLFSAALIAISAIYIFPTVVYNKFLYPKIHRLANQNTNELHRIFIYGSKYMLGIGSVSAIALAIAAPYVLPILFGNDFSAAIPILQILTLAIPLRFASTGVGAMLLTEQHMLAKVGVMGSVAVMSVFLNLCLIDDFGIMGAAYATITSEFLLLLLYWLSVKRLVFRKISIKNESN